MKKMIGYLIILSLLTFAILPIISINGEETNQGAIKIEELPTLESYDNLKQILTKAESLNRLIGGMRYGGIGMDVVMTAEADGNMMKGSEKSSVALDGAQDSYSTTNVQVKGVDEADVVKTDGQFIYQVNHNSIVIIRATPVNEMKVIKKIEFKEENLFPQEIYVDDKHLVVIGSSQITNEYPEKPIRSSAEKLAPPNYYHKGTVKAVVFDISDMKNIKETRSFEVEGYYVSSRKIGSSLYLIANKYIDMYHIQQEDTEPARPMYRDSLTGNEIKDINYTDIHYFPQSVEPNYLMIAGVDLDSEKEINIETYLGAGQNIYASENHLYAAVTHYKLEDEEKLKETNDAYMTLPEKTTALYKFQLNQGNVVFSAQGEVPGSILNQFSMDENNNYFRIATTKGEMWRDDEHTSKNNLYVLDDELEIVGEIEDIAPGERIYSVRFMGNRAYMVTFKKVDPLFVIDLEEPTEPKILGKLKIPGYSDYLHPYDENHIIGFGKDTMQDSKNDDTAYYQGMKIAMFDVSDVNHPKEKFVEIIGDRGTDSELLRNHRALLFSKNRNLLAFPVTVMEVANKENKNIHQYGEFSFQGAYVYHVDLEHGFDLQSKITHLNDVDYRKASDRWYHSNANVERILYIEDVLYTISKTMIKANKIGSYQELNHLSIR